MHSARTNRRLQPISSTRTLCKSAGMGAAGTLALTILSALLLIAARPAHAQSEAVLYNFTDGGDGGGPQSSLTSSGGNFYGTTWRGGAFGAGTVFELSPNGSGGWSENVLYAFTGGTDGGNPTGPVIFDSQNNIYGTAASGGANGANGGGVVFELSLVGNTWNETVLYSFTGETYGGPNNGVIFDTKGNLYGTAAGLSKGTVFELTNSAGSWTEQVLYTADTNIYAGLVMDPLGNIFGTSLTAVFELSPNGSGFDSNVIYTFENRNGGIRAQGTPVLDSAGNIYGTITSGGPSSNGTVYELSLNPKGEWVEEVLHGFNYNLGSSPVGGVILDAPGNLYGTTYSGTPDGDGIVYELEIPAPETRRHHEKVLWKFDGTDGAYPAGSLIMDSSGKLYGTTFGGGLYSSGTVFAINPTPFATSTTITSSPDPSTPGEPVTLTATVTWSGGAPPDGETVSFVYAKTLLGTGTLSGGTATLVTSTIKRGLTTIKAEYPGDFNLAPSTSRGVNQIVNK